MRKQPEKEPSLRINIPPADKGFNTIPTQKRTRMTVVCTDDCDNCIMFKLGCARRCARFPDNVCEACPCRASAFAGQINEVGMRD
jgi:hypothetical protein